MAGCFLPDSLQAAFTNFLYPSPYIFQNLEFALPSICHAPSLLKRENMNALNFLLAVAAFLIPLWLAWLFINRK